LRTRAVAPIGTLRTMTVRLVATSRTGCSGASALVGLLSAVFPLRNGAGHPEMGRHTG